MATQQALGVSGTGPSFATVNTNLRLAPCVAGGFYCASTSGLARFGASGSALWGGSLSNLATAACASDADGNLYFAYGTTNQTFVRVQKVDATGQKQWEATVSSGTAAVIQNIRVAVDGGSNVWAFLKFRVSDGGGGDSFARFVVVKVSSTGTVVFQKELTFPSSSSPRYVQAISCGTSNAIVSARSDSGGNLLIALDTNGAVSWSKTTSTFVPQNMAMDADGNYYVAFYISGNSVLRGGLAKYDQSGAVLWRTYKTVSDASGSRTSIMSCAVNGQDLFFIDISGVIYKTSLAAEFVYARSLSFGNAVMIGEEIVTVGASKVISSFSGTANVILNAPYDGSGFFSGATLGALTNATYQSVSTSDFAVYQTAPGSASTVSSSDAGSLTTVSPISGAYGAASAGATIYF